MAKRLQLRRGTTAEHSTFTGAVGEVTVDTDKDTAVVHDGSTTGGYALALEQNVDNIDNTSDVNKPVSTATQELLDTKVSSNVNTVEDLASIANPSINDTVVVTEEGRGGVFIYRVDGTSNDGTIFDSSSTGKWHRQYEGAINVKWFGAVGDGITDDYNSIQSTIDVAEDNQGGVVYFPQGVYKINSGLVANDAVLLKCDTNRDITSSTNGSGAAFSRVTILWDGAVGGYMFTLEPQTQGDIIFGGGSEYIQWNGNNKAAVAVYFNNTKYSLFDGKIRQVTYAGLIIGSAQGSASNFSMKNHVRSLSFIWGSVVACQDADGLQLKGNGSTIPATQQYIGDITGLVYNGSLVKIAETDNAQFNSVHGVVQSGGTGKAVELINAGAQGANHNIFFYCVGKVSIDNGLRGNNFINYNSEGGGITQAAGASLWDGDLIDYVTGERFLSHKFKLRDKISLYSSDFLSSTATIVKFALQWSALALAAGSNRDMSCIIPSKYDLNDGYIESIDIIVGSNGTSGGDYVLGIALSIGDTRSVVVTPEVEQQQTLAVGAQYTPITYNFNLGGTPLAYSKGDNIFLILKRRGGDVADTNTDDMMILGSKINYVSDAPNSAGSGTYDIPDWS